MVFTLSMSWSSTIYKIPHLVIPGKGRSGQFATPVELVLAQETHQCQLTSSEQYSKQELIKLEGLREAGQTTMVHRKCISALREQ